MRKLILGLLLLLMVPQVFGGTVQNEYQAGVLAIHNHARAEIKRLSSETWQDRERQINDAIAVKRTNYLAAHPEISPAFKKAIEDHKPYLGMSEVDCHQMFELWNRGGWLDDVNRTTTRYGETCQWVIYTYCRIGYKYLYFDNGKLVAIER